jgi:hypothetical protein
MISDVDKASAGLADHPFIERWTWIIHVGKVFLICARNLTVLGVCRPKQ